VVLMLHERYGPVQHSFNCVDRVAQEGFVACVPDVFHRYEGDRAPIENSQGRVDPTDAETIADLDETIAYLRTLPNVDGDRIGIAGFCLSGRTPIVYAAARNDVTAIAVFHGGVYPRDYVPIYPGQQTVAELIPNIPCPVLGGFGELDPSVPLDHIQRFRSELEEHQKSYTIRIYGAAPHGWMNSTIPDRYRPEKSEAAWTNLIGFYRQVFAGEWDTGRARWEFASDRILA
jgi:carboxymethylenebutenolidase